MLHVAPYGFLPLISHCRCKLYVVYEKVFVFLVADNAGEVLFLVCYKGALTFGLKYTKMLP